MLVLQMWCTSDHAGFGDVVHDGLQILADATKQDPQAWYRNEARLGTGQLLLHRVPLRYVRVQLLVLSLLLSLDYCYHYLDHDSSECDSCCCYCHY